MKTNKDSLLIHKIEITNCRGIRGTHTQEFSTDDEHREIFSPEITQHTKSFRTSHRRK